MTDTIHPEAVLTALARIDGTPFEHFVNEFASNLLELDFKPLGGIHDGGADGFVVTEIFEAENEIFAQASVRDDVSTKIRQTIKRLREFGRSPTRLYYFSSHKVENIDSLEVRLSRDLKCNIDIRDATWSSVKINSTNGTRAAYANYLAPVLTRAGFGSLSERRMALDDANIPACVFLSYEVDLLVGNKKFQEGIVDSLIVWALEGTDPGTGVVKTREQIGKTIVESFPFAKKFALGVLSHRLDKLSSKSDGNNRSVTWDGRHKGYCLPFETRLAVVEEHAKYAELQSHVEQELGDLAKEMCLCEEVPCEELVRLEMKTLETLFKHEGLKVLQSIDDKIEISETTVSDIIEEAFSGENLSNSAALSARRFCLEATRRMIYQGSPASKAYLSLLSRTYSLLFLLRHEPRVVEYFQKLQSSYRLVIGGELITRALSEGGLPPADRATESTFKLLTTMGSELILCEHVLDEVISHIRATDFEYKNHYLELDQFISPDLASQIDRILIRSYFYNKFAGNTKSWGDYIDGIVPYSRLHQPEGRQALKTYLTNQFGFGFMDQDEVDASIDGDELERLTAKVMKAGFKDDIRLARNDVANMLLVYALRRKNGESSGGEPTRLS